MKNIEVGQILYVETIGMFIDIESNLSEYKVTKVTHKYIYTIKKNSDFIVRFDKKIMTYNGGIGYIYKAYMSEEEYQKEIDLKNEINTLRTEISKALSSVDINQLREIKEIL